MAQDVAVINYAVYENKTEYLGIAQVDLPSLEFMTQTINGAGIAGEVEPILVGQMKAMEITFKHNLLTAQAIKLSAPKLHTLELREVQENVNNKSGGLVITGVKHVVKVFPKKMDGGTLKPQSTSDPNTVASVHYWAEYRDGEKVLELDPLNWICEVDGTDYLKPVRTALGK
jgi:hypothetical protein